jgi:hypothetical protein
VNFGKTSERATRRASRIGGAATLAALCLTVAGCGGSDPREAYLETQSSIQTTLASEHLPVSSVTCTPRAGQLAWTDRPAHLHCTVRFKSGASYTTPATVQPVVDQPDALTWSGPPSGIGQIDITKAPLPSPSSSLAATSAQSLFDSRNLRPVLAALDNRFAGQAIIQLVLYPGELEAVIATANGEARLVTANAAGKLVVGPPSGFNGSRDSIYLSQLNASVPERLANAISLHGGVSTARLARFVLYFTGQNAGWNIYPLSSEIRFQSLLMGDSLKAITASGVRRLN